VSLEIDSSLEIEDELTPSSITALVTAALASALSTVSRVALNRAALTSTAIAAIPGAKAGSLTFPPRIFLPLTA
jgi:hypothetical protein